MKAIVNDQVIAESNHTEVVEGNHYFPPSSVKKEFLKETNTHTTCPWKGEASYYTIAVHGEELKDAACTILSPKTLPKTSKTTSPSIPIK